MSEQLVTQFYFHRPPSGFFSNNRLHMNPPPKKLNRLAVWEVFLCPHVGLCISGTAVVFFYKPWVIFSRRKKFDFFSKMFSYFLSSSKFFQDGFGKDFPYSAIREILTKTVLKKLRWAQKIRKHFRKKIEFFPPAKYHPRLVEKHHGGARDAQTHMGAKENLSNCQSVKFFWRRIHMKAVVWEKPWGGSMKVKLRH